MGGKLRARALCLKAVNHGVLTEPDLTGQAVGNREEELPVGFEHRGIGSAGCRKFFHYRQLPVLPLIDARREIGLRRGGRTMNEVDLDEIETSRRLRHGKFASSGTAQRLMRHEPTGVPAIEKGFSGEIGKGEPSLAVRAEEFVGTPALRRKFLEGRERLTVPNHQTGRACVIGISEEML